MNKKGGLFLSIIIIIVAVIIGFVLGLKYSKPSNDLTELQNQLDQRDIEIINLKEQLNSEESEIINNFECPIYDIIDCMPPVPTEMVGFCSGDYHDWINENCEVEFTF